MTTATQAQAAPIWRSKTTAVWIMAAIPMVTVLMIYLLAIRTWIQIGAWPQPYQPDPKDVSTIQYGIALLGVPASLVAGFGSIGALLMGLKDRDRSVLIPAAIGTIGAVLLWFVLGSDLGTWLID